MDSQVAVRGGALDVSKRRKRGSLSGMRRKETIAGYLFLLPNLVGFLTFSVFPIAAALFLTFTDWDLSSTLKLSGLANFSTMLNDELFGRALFNTFYFTFVSVPTAVFIAFWLAVLINRKMRGVLFFRLIYFAPHLTLMVAAAMIWAWIYQPEFGLINYLLSLIGIQGPRWLFDSQWAMLAIIIMSNWKAVGYSMLIFLAGLQGVPEDLYEAAIVDGATSWQRLRHITIPLLSPTTFFVVTTSLIGSLQGFNQFYIMTAGGPAFSTTSLVLYIYNNAFMYFKMGYAASMAAILFLCILIITLIQWKVAQSWVYGFETQKSR